MQGERVRPDETGALWLAPGEYGQNVAGEWCARPPGGRVHMGSLKEHDVTEHGDGTITVSPSILIQQDGPIGLVLWHGYLERGVWREL